MPGSSISGRSAVPPRSGLGGPARLAATRSAESSGSGMAQKKLAAAATGDDDGSAAAIVAVVVVVLVGRGRVAMVPPVAAGTVLVLAGRPPVALTSRSLPSVVTSTLPSRSVRKTRAPCACSRAMVDGAG